jgi:hypothetical protein
MTGLVEDVEVTIVQADWVGRDIFVEKILYWIGWSRIRSGRINLDEFLEKKQIGLDRVGSNQVGRDELLEKLDWIGWDRIRLGWNNLDVDFI